MTLDEMGRVLAAAAALDKRTVGPSDVAAWYETVGGLDFDDALAAVWAHYARSTEWLMPAHVARLCEQAARERAETRRQAARARAVAAIEAAEAATPAEVLRSPHVQALIAELRDRLPVVPDVLRRPEVAQWDRDRARAERADAAPNPAFVGVPPPGGYPLPAENARPAAELLAQREPHTFVDGHGIRCGGCGGASKTFVLPQPGQAVTCASCGHAALVRRLSRVGDRLVAGPDPRASEPTGEEESK